jgi:hypothetical protein
MFVDNNTSYTNRFLHWIHHKIEPSQVVDYLKHDAQVWECLLWMSGGLLKLIKCLYCVMYWQFDAEGKATLAPVASPILPIPI